VSLLARHEVKYIIRNEPTGKLRGSYELEVSGYNSFVSIAIKLPKKEASEEFATKYFRKGSNLEWTVNVFDDL
jgi:hypothetical protein